MEKYIKRSDAIKAVGQQYRYESDRMTALQEVPVININEERFEPCEPSYLGENIAIGCRDGRCRCGNIVRSYQHFCDQCGAELAWGNVHAITTGGRADE